MAIYIIPGHDVAVNQGTRRHDAITDATGGGATAAPENASAINEILSTLMSYGLVATA